MLWIEITWSNYDVKYFVYVMNDNMNIFIVVKLWRFFQSYILQRFSRRLKNFWMINVWRVCTEDERRKFNENLISSQVQDQKASKSQLSGKACMYMNEVRLQKFLCQKWKRADLKSPGIVKSFLAMLFFFLGTAASGVVGPSCDNVRVMSWAGSECAVWHYHVHGEMDQDSLVLHWYLKR